ncbi:MAG TPA: hypothetical protein VGV87_30905 [Blastocatellia bacterium]|jgi:hypothetical protein|nr:hypothetical protein [Blastocatellia bacterium]
MGTTYQNLTVCGAEQGTVVEALRTGGLAAFVTPEQRHFTVVFSKRGDAWDSPDAASDVAGTLSYQLGCPVFIAAVFDDDVLFLSLFEGLDRTFEYNSRERRIVNLRRLHQAAGGKGWFLVLWAILKLPHFIPYFIESFRHLHVLKALHMPTWAFAIGYTNIQRAGELPLGLTVDDLVET